jgi:hypothetical protein
LYCSFQFFMMEAPAKEEVEREAEGFSFPPDTSFLPRNRL